MAERLRRALRAHPWRAELMLMAALLLGFIAGGWFKYDSLTDKVRDQAQALCETRTIGDGYIRRQAQLANDGLRSVSSQPPPPRVRAVIAERQKFRRQLSDDQTCQQLFND